MYSTEFASTPWYETWFSYWWFGLEAWAFFFVTLLLLGLGLSAFTLSEAKKLAVSKETEVSPMARYLRTVYRGVVGLGSVGYYVSLPLLAASMLFLGGGLMYLIFSAGRVPIKLVAILAFVVLASLWAILKGLWVRTSDEDPGMRLLPSEAPAFFHMLAEVAKSLNTRVVDSVFLTPGTDIAVFERGGFFQKLSGRGERCLILGLGVLENFRLLPFKSVLAHEYGHFSNKDTAGGNLALMARSALMNLGVSLAHSGAATWYNPAWLFFRGYYAAFLRISQGASRLQEILADRVSIFRYGSQAFVEGYRHVLSQSVRFDANVVASVNEVLQENRYLANVYRYQPAAATPAEEIENNFRELFEREASAYDSHPCPRDRVSWAQSLNIPSPLALSEEWVWDLFPSREHLEQKLTEQLKRNLEETHDVAFARGATLEATG